MLINYKLNSKGYIIEYTSYPFDSKKPWISVPDNEVIYLNWDKVVDGRLVRDYVKIKQLNNLTQKIEKLETELTNYKGQLVDTDYLVLKHSEGFLTDEQFSEVSKEREQLRGKVRDLETRIQYCFTEINRLR